MRVKSKFLFPILTLACCFLLIQPAAAQPTVKATVDARKITIGDQVKLWLELKPGSKNDVVKWPAMPDSLTGLEIVEKGKIDTLTGNGGYSLKQRLLVTGFDSGSYYIPSFTFSVIANGQTVLLTTDSILVQVQTIPVDTAKPFKPIKEIVEVKSSVWDYWQIMLGAVLLIVFGAFIAYYFYKNRKTKMPVTSKVPPEKAHEKALRLLKELEARQLWQSGRIKEYYSELSDIVRIYLEERFSIPAMEQTTDELLALLKKQNDSRTELRKARPELKLILRTADLAKFAKANPLPDEHSACMAAALQIVQLTQVKKEGGSV
jgi:hypothetical protein